MGCKLNYEPERLGCVDIQPQHEYYDKKSKVSSAFDNFAIPRGRDCDEDMEERRICKSHMKPQRPRIL